MYLDTANIQEITDAYQTNLFLGVTTNPTILWKEKQPRFVQLKAIGDLGVGELFCQLIGESVEARYQDYLRIKAYSNQLANPIVIKVPLDRMGLEVIKRIKTHDSHQQILATAVYSSMQGILASMAGCDYVAPYVNRMEVHNINPYEEIRHIRDFIEARKLPTKIIAASFKQPNQVTKALAAGAHTITVSYEVFQAMTNNNIVNDAVAVFEEHGNAY